MVRSAECTALRRRCRRKNRNLSLCRTYTEAKKRVSKYPTGKRSDGYRYALMVEDVLRRSSIEPGLGGYCYPCWAASAFAVLASVLVQAPCEGRALLVVVSAQTIVFVRALAWRGLTESICCRPAGTVCGCEMADDGCFRPRAAASIPGWVLQLVTWASVSFPCAPSRAPCGSRPCQKQCLFQRTRTEPSSSFPSARGHRHRSQ